MGLHAGVSVPLLWYASCSSGLAIPTLSSQAPTALEGERIKLVPCYILAQCSCGHQYGRAKGSVLQNGVSRVPRPFAEEHPWALHPWAAPWGQTQLPAAAPAAASWGHCGSPFPVPRLPKSLETHQLSSKPLTWGLSGREGAVGSRAPSCQRWLICRERGERGTR